MLNKTARLFLVLFVSLQLFGCRDTLRYAALPEEAVVLALGDSVTYGTGAPQDASYPVRLAERSGWNIINAGIPGDTAGNARSRIAPLLQENSPAMVIVELGGNDFLRRRPQRDVKEDLRSILQSVKASGAIPVLVAVPAPSLLAAGGSLSDAAIYSALAEEEEVLLVEDVFSQVLSDRSLRADPIHPNAQGYQALADGIADALSRAGLLARH